MKVFKIVVLYSMSEFGDIGQIAALELQLCSSLNLADIQRWATASQVSRLLPSLQMRSNA